MARLAALRMMAGLSPREVARRLGLRYRDYLALERGIAEPTPAQREALAALYDIPPESLTEGPLPIPTFFAPPMTAEDDLVDAYLDALAAIERLDRYRQALGQDWPSALREHALPHIPLPFPRQSLPIAAPTRVYLDLPHIVSIYPHQEAVVSRKGQKPLTLRHPTKVLLHPGSLEIAPAPGRTALLRIQVWRGKMGAYEIPY